jgi:hypothetical protein
LQPILDVLSAKALARSNRVVFHGNKFTAIQAWRTQYYFDVIPCIATAHDTLA